MKLTLPPSQYDQLKTTLEAAIKEREENATRLAKLITKQESLTKLIGSLESRLARLDNNKKS